MAYHMHRTRLMQQLYTSRRTMTPETWERFTKQMFAPVLLRMTAVYPGKLPERWITKLPCFVPPENSMKRAFYDLCAILQLEAVASKEEYLRRIERAIEAAKRLDTLMRYQKVAQGCRVDMTRQRVSYESRPWKLINNISTQISSFSANYGPTYFVIAPQHHVSTDATVISKLVIERGLVDFSLSALPGVISDMREEKQQVCFINTMLFVQTLLRTHVDDITDRRLALAMALHRRLGADAGMGALTADLMCAFAPVEEFPRHVLWHEMLWGEEEGRKRWNNEA